MATKKKFEDLDITQDEAKRLTEALKNEEFRKLFVEYAQEIQDPENRRRYEAELAEMEAQRGMDVKFIHPEPGYVIKTSVDGTTKAFINICKNEHVGKPSFERGVNPTTGQAGQAWSVPHSLAPPREDFDKNKSKCQVYDVVFHPDTYRMGESNIRFRKLINDTALSAIERQFAVTLDKNNVKFPKIKFKGTPQATVIRDRKKDADGSKPKEDGEKGLMDEVLDKIPYPYDNKTSREKAEENERKAKEREAKKLEASKKEREEKNGPTVPQYTITHRKDLDFQEFTNAPDAKSDSTRPNALVIAVDLPLLKSASSVNLDIFEKSLFLESTTPAKYKLDLNLHYKVDESNGSAKFDKSKKRLVITLPVLKEDPKVVNCATKDESDGNNVSNGEGTAHHEEEDPTPSPLIEVISSTDTPTSQVEEQSETNGDIIASLNEEVNQKNAYNADLHQNGFTYELPNYTATQDWETTTFVLNVKNVKRESLMKTFSESGFQVKFATLGSGGFPMYYSFFVKFDEIDLIESTACDVSISDENLVIVLGKSSEAAGLWEGFQVGIDAEHLEEALFVTEKTLSSALDQLDVNTMPLNNNDKMPDLEVTQMNDDHLTIQLTNVKEKHSRSKKYSESSDDIEVVHTNAKPQLHGILKDRSRTVSESSDEAFQRGAYRREDSVSSIFSTGSASEGIVSESEEGMTPTRKKSVSFSEHVDQTTYKSSSTVSALHASLKKKNKRYRKKEARIERRRRRSSGSEHEHSSEEQSSQPDSSEMEVHDGNDDDDDVIIDHYPEPLPEETKTELLEEDDENDISSKQASKKAKKNKKKNKGKKSKEVPCEAHAASHIPPETRKSDASESESAAETVSSPDGERTNGVNLSDMAVMGSGDDISDDLQSKTVSAKKSGDTNDAECDDSDDGESPLHSAPPGDKDKERTNAVQKGSDGGDAPPETILNWKEGSVDTSDVTKCAFNFSNSMMYELDDD